MTSEGNPWPHSIKKHLKKLFIHDSSEEHAFPQILSPNHTSSSKFISKTKFEKVYLWNSLFFFVNHEVNCRGDTKWDWKSDYLIGECIF
jgi:hypothetical protein